MAATVLTNCAIYAAQADLSGRSNRVALEAEAEEVESTTFGDGGFRSYVGGLKTTTAEIEGYFEALDATYPDDRLWTDLGVSDVPHTISEPGGALGDPCYFFRSMRAKYGVGGSIGDLLGFTGSAGGSNSEGLVRGTILNSAASAKTATGSGTAYQLGAVTSTQHVYAALHVLSISGTSTPTLTVRLQSDTSGFPSATTQTTFTAATAIGSEWKSVAGPITDDYWRADWTISGTNPSFLFVLAVGIAS